MPSKLLILVLLRSKRLEGLGAEMSSKLLMFVTRSKDWRDWAERCLQAADVCATQVQRLRDWGREMSSQAADVCVTQAQGLERLEPRDALQAAGFLCNLGPRIGGTGAGRCPPLLMFVPLRSKDWRDWGREMPSKLLMFV